VEEKIESGTVAGTPARLMPHKHAAAYFGVFRLTLGDQFTNAPDMENFIDAALETEQLVHTAIAENSLNPQNIETAIRKALLPKLFNLVGLDQAKVITDQIVSITRIGLSRGHMQP
jgi:type I restriction enzyme, R subunit